MHPDYPPTQKNASLSNTPQAFFNTEKAFGPLMPFLQIILYVLILLSLSRLLLVFIFSRHLNFPSDLYSIFLQGLRVDLAFLSMCFSLPLLLYIAVQKTAALKNFLHTPIAIYLSTFFASFVFFELVTPMYLSEYGVRPERKFYEYLNTPAEVSKMLIGMYGGWLIPLALIPSLSFYFCYRKIRASFKEHATWSLTKTLLLLPLVFIILTLTARSSFDHRPLNPSMVAFSNNATTNALPLNSLYSVLYSIYQLKDESTSSEVYGKLNHEEVMKIIQQEKKMYQPAAENNQVITTHKNIVIILEESLGARFVSELGGEKLTPQLDQLLNEGIRFNQLYATGTRSVRGIESVITGFPPTPSFSVVKLSESQQNFFTLAQLLKQYDYQSHFYYGGEAHFDNMKGFFLGNGFDEVIEQPDFITPNFVGSWGASDEDVFSRMHEDLLKETGKPKLYVTLTTSNHTPFDFPDYEGMDEAHKEKTRENAVRYADYALGSFIAKAKLSPYWQDTIFLIVADHDLRASDFQLNHEKYPHGKLNQVFPVDAFHIPAVILGGNIPIRAINTRASQIDLPLTLLAMAGIHEETPMIGRNLVPTIDIENPGRAIMQYNELQAYWQANQLVILRPNQKPMSLELKENHDFVETHIPALELKALAQALWASLSYENNSYQLDPISKSKK